MLISDAELTEAASLTALARRAKASWGYPAEWLELWADDLSISPDYLRRHVVKTARVDTWLAGFIALNLDDHEIDHFWIAPEHQRQGIGRQLWQAMEREALVHGITVLTIVSDPNAEAFYQRMGAIVVGQKPSVPAPRALPILRYTVRVGTSDDRSRGQ